MSNEIELVPTREIDDAVVEAQTRAYHRLKKEYLGDRGVWRSEETQDVRNLLQILQIAKEMGVY